MLLGGSRAVPAQSSHGWQMQLYDARAITLGTRFPNSALRTPGLRPAASARQAHSALVELARAGEWTLVGLASGANSQPSLGSSGPAGPLGTNHSALRTNDSALPTPHSAFSPHPFLPELRGRLESLARSVPFSFWATNNWLEAELDIASLVPLFWSQSSQFQNPPRIALSVTGDGVSVRTRGQLDFPKPLPYRNEKWDVPTNLISQPLASFTAIRGIAPWLASLKAWNDLRVGPPPNQFSLWALDSPMQTFFAAPQPDASNQVSRLTDLVLQKGADYFATNGRASFERAQDFNGVEWKGIPFLTPFFRSLVADHQQFLFGGLLALPDTNGSPPVELMAQLSNPTNLVCYDWELTGMRSSHWFYIGQFARFSSLRQQMDAVSAGMSWLKATTLTLGNCGTVVTLPAPNQLSVVRKSSVGFTAFELHLLADWLESPDFPRGLHSLSPVPQEVPPRPPAAPESKAPSEPGAPEKR